MPAADPDALAHARLQGKRAALGLVIGVAAIFIAASAVQIVPAIFGTGVTPMPALGLERDPTAPPVDDNARVCAEGIRDRLQRATLRAGAAEAPWARWTEPESPDDAKVAGACEKARGGADAWASLARLLSAEEQLKGDRPGELEPLRRDVAAHLPADLR